jgi:iron complex transport system substrate-binding protein
VIPPARDRPQRPVGVLLLLSIPFILTGSACGTTREPEGGRSGEEGPRRLAVLAPAAAEMVVELGAETLVVAVGDFVDWPPRLAELPRIGSYDAPNLERLLELEVDLLVTARSAAGQAAHRRVEGVGIAVLELETETFEGVLRAFEELGEALGRGARARAAVDAVRERIAALQRRTAGLTPRRVLYVAGDRPLYGAGPGSHIDRLITAAGGINVLADAPGPYPLIALEAVLERRPEVIIDGSDNRPGALRGRRPGAWGQWEFLPAVAAERVWYVHPERLAVPGPRLPEMAELLARLIHPEVFGAPTDEELGPLRERGRDR